MELIYRQTCFTIRGFNTMLLLGFCLTLVLSVYCHGDTRFPNKQELIKKINVQTKQFNAQPITWKHIDSKLQSVKISKLKVDILSTYEVNTGIAKPSIIKSVDCSEVLRNNPSRRNRDGVYTIFPDKLTKKKVFCDMTTGGGGWTVIQNRIDGSTDFYRTWREYKAGFGNSSHNYWIGNDVIHMLTKYKTQKLRVELQRFSGEKGYAEYSTFAVGDETSKYKLNVSGFKGNIGDSLAYHNGMKFSTKDQDNNGSNCAASYHGAWWYKGCLYSNLNGLYANSPKQLDGKAPNWYHWKSSHEALKTTRMMIRPAV